ASKPTSATSKPAAAGGGGKADPATPARASAKKSAAQAPAPAAGASGDFLDRQRALLLDERATYVRQADELKAQADSLALEHEPGDVQFDEEGGEGGTANIDRELDIMLSSQARAAVEEIDRALAKIDAGTYGRCERCGTEIPEARLEALPHASLCVSCKSGGLSSRR
ncbi:MAG TPA: TraR/DksA C4-type zinc finger protein, partial [Acidimicrobiales bacterium]|nr:TraR/DksA C4-type zinc finger protein [Acidimicrobiales bacterium]